MHKHSYEYYEIISFGMTVDKPILIATSNIKRKIHIDLCYSHVSVTESSFSLLEMRMRFWSVL